MCIRCALCSEILDETTVTRISNCDHIFCKDCITHWYTLSNLCPICKRSFSTLDMEETSLFTNIEFDMNSIISFIEDISAPIAMDSYSDVETGIKNEVVHIRDKSVKENIKCTCGKCFTNETNLARHFKKKASWQEYSMLYLQ